MALSYGSHQEIAAAARSLAEDCVAGKLSPGQIDETLLESRLFTHGLPAPDLLIRTSGELRISNFLLWQLAYAELFFSDVLWPDFTAAELRKAFEFYAQRQRRFGLTGEQVEAVRC